MIPISGGLPDWRIPHLMTGRENAKRGVWGDVDQLKILPTTVIKNYTGIPIPENCSSITQLVFSNPGGRIGSDITVQVLHPIVPPIGKGLLHQCGHCNPGGWADFYTLTDGSSIATRLLAHGWFVLMVDMPNYGYQPQQSVIYAGQRMTLPKALLHVPNGSPYNDGVADTYRLQFDHLTGAINWAEGPGALGAVVACLGHSGGGGMVRQYAAIEDRPHVWYIMQGCVFQTQFFNTTEPEAVCSGTVETSCGVIAQHGFMIDAVLPFGFLYPGRTTVIHSADQDEYNGDQHVTIEAYMACWAARIPPGNSLSFYRKTTGTHNFDAVQAAWCENHLIANG